MSQRLSQRNLLGKPVTRKELLHVLDIFERNMDRKIWDALPFYVKFWRLLTRKKAQKRATKVAQAASARVARSEASQPATPGPNPEVTVGVEPT